MSLPCRENRWSSEPVLLLLIVTSGEGVKLFMSWPMSCVSYTHALRTSRYENKAAAAAVIELPAKQFLYVIAHCFACSSLY